MSEKNNYDDLLKYAQPVNIEPFLTQPVRLSLLDLPDVERQAEMMALIVGASQGERALLLGCLRMAQRQLDREPTIPGVLRDLDVCERMVREAVSEHRHAHEPLRAGGLLEAVVRAMEIPLEDIEGLLAKRASDTYDQPISPWTLLGEGESESAVQALLALLSWDEACRSEAHIVLQHWA